MKQCRYENQENDFDTKLLDEDRYTFSVLTSIVSRKCRLVLTDHENYLICYSGAPYPVWIWTAGEADEEVLSEVWELIKKELPPEVGYSYNTKYKTAEYLIRRSREEGGQELNISVNMLSYDCPSPVKPERAAEGQMVPFDKEDPAEIGAYLFRFKQDTGVDLESEEECLKKAEQLAGSGRVFLWKKPDGSIAATCLYRENAGFGCLGFVYTKPEERRKGYGENLVYGVTKRILENGLLPLLYADADYPASNGCYRKVGYREKGSLCTVCGSRI